MGYLKLLLTSTALLNLNEIAEYYEKKQKGLGYRFAAYYKQQTDTLMTMPNIGRSGNLFGTRELVFHEFPYIVVYRVRKTDIQILRIFHQSRKFPS
jgi:plasmid stabilization system protein ParE